MSRPHPSTQPSRPAQITQRRLSARASLRRAGLALVAAAALVGLSCSPAAAHDSLVSTSPADGATVSATPDQIVLTFNEPAVAVGTEIVVAGPDGQVQQGRPRLVENTVRQAVMPGAPAGRYTVTWRVTSDDGHPVSGTFAFTSTAPGATPSRGTPTAATTDPSTTTPTATSTTAAASETSGPTTGESAGTGTSWAVWLVVGLLVVAGVGAAVVRTRRGHDGGGLG